MNLRTRWLIRRDMPEVLEIEKATFEDCWAEEDFLTYMRQRNVIGKVAEQVVEHQQYGPIVGFVIYALDKKSMILLNFAVHPAHRRLGIGTKIMQSLRSRLSYAKRRECTVDVKASNLGFQLFLKATGWLCYGTDEDDELGEYYKFFLTADES